MFINQPFGVYETAAARQVTCDFAALEHGGFGLAIIQRNTPCIFRDGRLLQLLLSLGRAQVVGRQSYEYSIVSYAGDVHQANVRGISQAINTPLRVFWPPPGASPRSEDSFLTVDRANITLSALLVEGGRIQARLFETAGKATRGSVQLPFPPAECTQIKLNGEKVKALDVDGDRVSLTFRPWEILTVSTPKP